MNVIDSLFATQPQQDGRYSPITLPIWASIFLADIEQLFGPRDRSFTLLGIDIDRAPGSQPHLWFPNSGIPPGDTEGRPRHVIVHLGPNALLDPARARWQLAHECVHLLDPWNGQVDGRPTNWLEEGLAAWFQNTRVPEAAYQEGLYADAQALVEPFIGELQPAIRRTRMERRLRIGGFTPVVLSEYCPGLPAEQVDKLCRPFGS